MLHFDPDPTPQKDPPDQSLAESSLGGMVRVSFAGLDRTTHEYARALASLCLLMHARRVVVMDESAQVAVRDLDVFEWNLPYPDDVRLRSFPYFPGDRSKHDEMARLEREYVRLKRAQSAGEPFQGTFHTEQIHPNTPNTYPRALAAVEQQLDELFDGLRRRCGRGIAVRIEQKRSSLRGTLIPTSLEPSRERSSIGTSKPTNGCVVGMRGSTALFRTQVGSLRLRRSASRRRSRS